MLCGLIYLLYKGFKYAGVVSIMYHEISTIFEVTSKFKNKKYEQPHSTVLFNIISQKWYCHKSVKIKIEAELIIWFDVKLG